MAQVLYSARDRHGKAIDGFVEAASVQEARHQLENSGMTDIVLHQDPQLGATDARMLEGLNPAQLRDLARISIAAMKKPGLLQVLRDVAWLHRWWLAVDFGFLAVGLALQNAWLIAIGAGLAAFPFVVAAWTYRHGGRYNALLKAFAIGDWERVERLAEQLREFSRTVPHMEFDLAVRLAGVKARQGRLAEALAFIEPWREKLAMQPGMFEHRAAAIYYAGEDRQGYVRLMAQAHALTPQEPSRIVDLALAEVRFGDPEAAENLMRSLDVSLLPPFAQGFVAWIEGQAKVRLHQPGGVERLAAAVASFLPLAASQPAVWSALAFCTCDHAIALAMAGRKDDARRQLAVVWPILRAHGDRALLHMLQADGLAPTPNP